jgi:hypothetical protein
MKKQTSATDAGFEVLTAVTMGVVTPCSSERDRPIGGTYPSIFKLSFLSLFRASAGFLLGYLFDPEDRNYMFL